MKEMPMKTSAKIAIAGLILGTIVTVIMIILLLVVEQTQQNSETPELDLPQPDISLDDLLESEEPEEATTYDTYTHSLSALNFDHPSDWNVYASENGEGYTISAGVRIDGKYETVILGAIQTEVRGDRGAGPIDVGFFVSEDKENHFNLCDEGHWPHIYPNCETLVNENEILFHHYSGTYDYYGAGEPTPLNTYVLPYGYTSAYTAITLYDLSLTEVLGDHEASAAIIRDLVESIHFTEPRDQTVGTRVERLPLSSVSFEMPIWWGDVREQEDYEGPLTHVDIDEDRSAFFMSVLQNEPLGREGYWGDVAWQVTDENFDTYCDEDLKYLGVFGDPTCDYFTTQNGLRVVHIAGIWDSFVEYPLDTNVYILQHPNAVALVLSDQRLLGHQDLLGDVETQLRDLVDTIEFTQ